MFKIKRFRQIVMKYDNIYSNRPEIIKQDTDYYIFDLKNLIKDVNLQLEYASSFLEKICNIEANLSIKPKNVLRKFIQNIVDWFYDKILYYIEELGSCRSRFIGFKLRAEQVKIFHDNF